MARQYIPEPVPLDAEQLGSYLERELNRIGDAILAASEPDFGGMTLVTPGPLSVSATAQPLPFDAPLVGRNVIYDGVDYSLRPTQPGSFMLALVVAFDVQQQLILRIEAYADGVPTGIFVEIEIIQQQDREDITLLTLADLSGAALSFWISASSTQTIDFTGGTAFVVRL